MSSELRRFSRLIAGTLSDRSEIHHLLGRTNVLSRSTRKTHTETADLRGLPSFRHPASDQLFLSLKGQVDERALPDSFGCLKYESSMTLTVAWHPGTEQRASWAPSPFTRQERSLKRCPLRPACCAALLRPSIMRLSIRC